MIHFIAGCTSLPLHSRIKTGQVDGPIRVLTVYIELPHYLRQLRIGQFQAPCARRIITGSGDIGKDIRVRQLLNVNRPKKSRRLDTAIKLASQNSLVEPKIAGRL